MDISGLIKACREAGIDIRVSSDNPKPSMVIPLLSKTIKYDAEGNIIDESKWERQVGMNDADKNPEHSQIGNAEWKGT